MSNYSKISKQYKEYGKRATTDWILGHMNVTKLIEPVMGKKILDYGCGNGKYSIYLAELGAKVVGIDISPNQLEIAEGKDNKNITYLLENNPKIEIDYSRYFDSAVLNFVLCEMSSKKEIVYVLKRIHGLLKKDGQLVILNPNWDKSNGKDFLTHQTKYTPDLKSGCKVTTILKGDPPIDIPDYYWSKNDYLEMLEESGFSNFEILEPLAPNNGTEWRDEKIFPPFLIIKSRKIENWDKLFVHNKQKLIFDKVNIIVENGVFTCDPNITYSSSMILEKLPSLNGLRVADIGTGCGVIAVICALRGAKEVIATDISEIAIKNTKLNVKNNNVEDKVKVTRTDLFEGIEGKFDIITANLLILHEVWELHGIDTESTIERFLKTAKKFLNVNGKIYFPWASFADKSELESLLKKHKYHYELESVEKLGFNWYLHTIY